MEQSAFLGPSRPFVSFAVADKSAFAWVEVGFFVRIFDAAYRPATVWKHWIYLPDRLYIPFAWYSMGVIVVWFGDHYV